MYKYLFEPLFSILLDKYLEVVILCLIFGGTVILFSIEATPFYITASSAQEFQFIHIFAILVIFFLSLIIATLMGVK